MRLCLSPSLFSFLSAKTTDAGKQSGTVELNIADVVVDKNVRHASSRTPSRSLNRIWPRAWTINMLEFLANHQRGAQKTPLLA